MVLLQPEEKSMVQKPDKIQDTDSKAYLKIGSPQECKLWVGFNLSKQLFLRQLNRVMFYSNIVESQIIGNAVTDLLWEVVADGGQGDPVRYEPTHPHFLPVRERNLESITIQLYSTSGELMRVNHGNTLITLMFSRRSHRVQKDEHSHVTIICYVFNTRTIGLYPIQCLSCLLTCVQVVSECITEDNVVTGLAGFSNQL